MTTYTIQHLAREPEEWEDWRPSITITDLVSAFRAAGDSAARVGGVWRVVGHQPDGTVTFEGSFVRPPQGLPVPLPVLAEPQVAAAYRQMFANLKASLHAAQETAVDIAAELAEARAKLLSAELRSAQQGRLMLRLMHLASGVA